MSKTICYDEIVQERIISNSGGWKMILSKAILSVAAVAALVGANPHSYKAQAAANNSNMQENAYVYHGTDVNEINRILENFFTKNESDFSSTNSVKQTVQKQPNRIQQTPTTNPVQHQPVKSVHPKAKQTTSTLSAYEQKVVDLTNQERAKNGLPPLKVDLTLSKMAHEKSRDMSANGYFSHTSPTYGSPFDMMKQYGITYRYAGENIAMGQKTPEEVVNGWMNSAGHRANILNPNYNYIGVGYVAQGNYWTQDFIGK